MGEEQRSQLCGGCGGGLASKAKSLVVAVAHVGGWLPPTHLGASTEIDGGVGWSVDYRRRPRTPSPESREREKVFRLRNTHSGVEDAVRPSPLSSRHDLCLRFGNHFCSKSIGSARRHRPPKSATSALGCWDLAVIQSHKSPKADFNARVHGRFWC
ncbi:hypothetical protein NL676_004120 [Syzygium grande]|nr:hypothetical protein NL676_004120 [Syzygium grande]